MSKLDAVADRFEIEALRGEFADAAMLRDFDRLASLFTDDGVVRMPHINQEAVSRAEIRAGIERLQGPPCIAEAPVLPHWSVLRAVGKKRRGTRPASLRTGRRRRDFRFLR
jgi:hypothetical protein